MLHLVYVICVTLIAPGICLWVEHRKTGNKKENWIPLVCKWFGFWTLGVRAFTASLMQTVNPSYTEALLNVVTSDSIITRELGFAQMGLSVLAMLALWKKRYQKPAAVGIGIFIGGATLLHILRLSHIDFGEAVSLFSDLLILCICVLTLMQNQKCGKIAVK